MKSASFDVHNVHVRLDTDVDDFADFVEANYAPFVASDSGDVDIEVRVSEEDGEHAREVGEDLNGLGNGIRFSRDAVYWKNEFGFHILVTNCESTIRVRAFHDEFLSDQTEEERSQNLQRCMRWTTHFPLFTHFQYQRGWELIHAAAVSDGENTMAFCGLNKVGKSTLATYLCREHGYDILTDNFLLVGRERIFGFPEVIRLDPESLDQFELEPLWDHTVYGKVHVAPSSLGITLEADPDAFFLVTRGTRIEIDELKPENAWQSMDHLHTMLGEFPQHNFMSVWPLVVDRTKGALGENSLVTETPWYSISNELDWNLDEIADVIHGCI